MTTLLFDGNEANASVETSGATWVATSELERATGFHLEPKGFCRGEMCLPIPPGETARFTSGSRVNVAALAERLRRPVVRDDANDVISVGPEPGSRLASGEAPDFTLPDFDGRLHSLAQYRGKKVLILSWASW
ncbi:MAG: peroxiredoxin family protein [Candidatus Rokuibacteriota bacterium]